jgi:uncharacterized coiled-coil protein SlyX
VFSKLFETLISLNIRNYIIIMAIEPIEDMPKITVERDDVESFQRSRAQTNKTTLNKTTPSDDTKVAKSNSPSWLGFIMILLILCGFAGYWSFQQQKVLVQAQERISDLERRLSATGEELDQSAVALQVKVTELSKKTEDLWEQMDKLWASAWRRNQSEIADLDKNLKTFSSSTESKIKSLSEQNNKQDNAALKLDNQLTQYNQSLQLNQETLGQLKLNNENNEQQLASLREKLISAALGNNNLTNKVDDLERKITALEKTISSAAKTPSAPL